LANAAFGKGGQRDRAYALTHDARRADDRFGDRHGRRAVVVVVVGAAIPVVSPAKLMRAQMRAA
jgi:hypothetical protein